MTELSDTALARHIATTAGDLLLTLRASGLFTGKALGAAGDNVANAFIMAALAAQRPHDAVLSEEEKDSAARLTATRVWIVDPLDGTREYSEGRDDWAVHVALSIGGTASIGAVALPAVPLTLCTGAPLGPSPCAARPRVLVSRSRPPAEAQAVADAIGGDIVTMGSAGAKAMAVVRGDADIYLHSGGQYEWDSAAPVAVAAAAGLHVSRLDGSPMVYNQADVSMPDLLICSHELAAKVFAALKMAGR